MTHQTKAPDTSLRVGDRFPIQVESIAHGGHAIGHHAGRTIFVRHAIPGERVEAVVTAVNRKIVRADAVAVIDASEDRVEPPCPWTGPGGCGGCDFQHVSLTRQRDLKREVLVSSLQRFAGLDDAAIGKLGIRVEELPGHPDGCGWMTRVRWSRDDAGVVGLRRHRSHEVIPVDHCVLAEPSIDSPASVVSPSTLRRVFDRTWEIPASDFWQVHEGLPEALVGTVMEMAQPRAGEHWWDLYSGAGLFAAFIGTAVGLDGRVDAVEASPSAVSIARSALSDLPQVVVHEADTAAWISGADHEAPDGVILDPPRAGVGEQLMATLTSAEIPRLVYVACDPVALARDLAVARAAGYRLTALKSFDAFPMTHHLETVALLSR